MRLFEIAECWIAAENEEQAVKVFNAEGYHGYEDDINEMMKEDMKGLHVIIDAEGNSVPLKDYMQKNQRAHFVADLNA